MAGLAAEGLEYDKVVGQSADLFSLQVLYKIYQILPSSIFTFSFWLLEGNASEELFLFYLFLEVHKQDKASTQQRPATKSY
jgi:hypothetical protein